VFSCLLAHFCRILFCDRPPSRDTEALISEIERKVELNQTTPRWGARYILTSFLSNNAFTRNANQQGSGGGSTLL
jgi:hypothetical protein